MTKETNPVKIISPGEFMKIKRYVLVWTVITEDMRKYGYDRIQPYFEYPRHLNDKDICHIHQVALPYRFDFDGKLTGEPRLYDFANDGAQVTVTVGHDESLLTIHTYWTEKSEETYYRYPLKEAEFIH